MKFRLEAPPPRPGFTLTEVLMAMFVMALGMISLLALFPAGFINARWALDNEQVSRAAANGQAMTEMPRVAVSFPTGNYPLVSGTATSVRNDDYYRPDSGNTNSCWQVCANTATTALPPFIGRNTFLKLPAPPVSLGTWTFNGSVYAVPSKGYPHTTGVSGFAQVKYPPVFVDPLIAENPSYIDAITTHLPLHVGGTDNQPTKTYPFRIVAAPEVLGTASLRPNWSLGIPRFGLAQYFRDSLVGSSTQAMFLRKLTENALSDEVDFGTNGQPNLSNTTTGTYASQSRFTWAYMCHWYDFATPEICDVTSVLFNSRPDNGGMGTSLPGEYTFGSNAAVSLAGSVDLAGFGRVFVKGSNQVAIKLPGAEASKIKAGEWLLDSTMILPEFNIAFPAEVAPFLDEYNPASFYNFPTTGPPYARQLRPGLVGGHFYKVLDISPVRQAAGQFYQTITLDRPAKSDGFSATYLMGVADVISKGVGRMPQR